jgi:signal transduction histidine kinase
MKSVYAKILLWCFATLLVSLLAFSMVTRFVETRAAGVGGPMARFDHYVLLQARQAYESGGAEKLAACLRQVAAITGTERYLTSPAGKDLITGDDRSSLLVTGPPKWPAPWHIGGRLVMAISSADQRYRLITIASPPFSFWSLVPYYLLILSAVALICWSLAVSIASPLRDLARSVDSFGRGELSVRLHSRRRDEIGELSRSFDRMADRIGTLLTAERRLLQDVSHELRSPLARMSFAVELARRPDNREYAIDRMKSEIERLTDLVSSLLEVTRSEVDPHARKQETIRIDDLVHEVAEDCRIEADARGCHLAVETSSDPCICGDRELLRRAFENILRNAIRHAPGGSSVEIHLAATGASAFATIRDYGEGVPEEYLDKLCQPFFRADSSRNSSTGGVGLGLAIAQRAIQLHNGQLSVGNAHPGLEVSIELPVLQMRPCSGANRAAIGSTLLRSPGSNNPAQ